MSLDVSTRIAQIDEILENEIVNRSSFFQLQHFAIGSLPTTQAKMWQCLRELKRKREAIQHLQSEIDEMKDDIELAEIELEREKASKNIMDAREHEIRLRKKTRRIESSKAGIKNLEKRLVEELEESSFYAQAFRFFNEKEPLKSFDDPGAQREYWNEKLSQELNLSLIFKRPIGIETIKCIFALDNDSPIKKELINIVGQLQLEDENSKKLEKPKENND